MLQPAPGLIEGLALPQHEPRRISAEQIAQIPPAGGARILARLQVHRVEVEVVARGQILLDRMGGNDRLSAKPPRGLGEGLVG